MQPLLVALFAVKMPHFALHGPEPWMSLVNSTGNGPSVGRPTPGVVKQDKSSGGSGDTTKPRLGPQRVRMSSGERPIGAAKRKQTNTMALCQPPTARFRHSACVEV